jgi:hypothetical protein
MLPIELIHKIFGWPGIAALCGVLPVACALLLISSALKNQHVQWVAQASQLTVSSLKPSEQPVRLKGRIVGILQPLTALDAGGHAVLGVRVEEIVGDDGILETRIFRFGTTPFWLDDGTGLILVDPSHLDREFLGDGIEPTQEQMEEAMQIMGCSPDLVREPGLRTRMWELRKGEQVTVVGRIYEHEGQITIAKAEGHPFVVTAMDEARLASHSIHQAKMAMLWAFVLGVPGMIVLFFSVREIAWLLRRLLNQS